MGKQLLAFIIRWLLNTFGLWLAIHLFGTGRPASQLDNTIWVFLLAGLIFSVINSVLRPLIIILSLPAILLTLGLFTFVVNGFMVYVSLKITPDISVTFWHAILTGLVVSLLNYIVNSLVDFKYQPTGRKENI